MTDGCFRCGADGCFRCGSPDHWRDLCPHLERAASRTEHEARIAGYVQRFLDGRITPREKAAMIREENALWYGRDMPASLKALSN